MIAILLLVGIASVHAREVRVTHDVSVDAARDTLTRQGFVINKLYRENASLVIDLPAGEGRDPAAVVLAMPTRAAQRQAMLEELETIEAAIDAGNETAVQRRRFMKIILRLNGWAKRP